MLCFTRLIRLLLGESAIADEKNECAKELVVLGIQALCALCRLALKNLFSDGAFQVKPSLSGISFTLSQEKAGLESNKLNAGDAGKLAGRLSWSTQHLFFRVGRAMLRAIFDQKRSRCVV